MKYTHIQEADIQPGIKVIVRVDFNVPVQNGKVTDDYRICQSLETLRFLLGRGAIVLAISHIESEENTLEPVYPLLTQAIPEYKTVFCHDILECGKEEIEKAGPGTLILFENVRLYDGEKKNDETFARGIAALGELYVNEAFSVSHRKHASVHALPALFKKRAYAGFQFDTEIQELSVSFKPPHPFIFILGGAKFETKLPLIEKFIPLADTLFIGGAVAHTFYKEAGYEMGTSLVSEGEYATKKLRDSGKILLPKEVIVENSVSKEKRSVDPSLLSQHERIVDCSEVSLKDLEQKIREAAYIVWNGPLGSYEEGYDEGTIQLARSIAMCAPQHAKKIVGGGDTLAAIEKAGLMQSFTFVSTGGGAMLDFLANGTIPGLEVLMH